MANEQIVVEPRAGASAPEAESSGGTELSDELLKIPALQAVFAGTPAAFSASMAELDKLPEAKLIASHKNELMNAGFGLYRTLDGKNGVLFNSLYVSPEEIKQADQSGQLSQIAPPFMQLNQSVAASGAANPVLNHQGVPTGMKGAPAIGSPAPMAGPKQAPASVQKTLASKRAANLQVGAPSSGPVAGAGELLRSIMKPIL